MEKLFSLDEAKFSEAHDVLTSLGTGKYSDPENTPGTGDRMILFAALLPTSAAALVLLRKKRKAF